MTIKIKRVYEPKQRADGFRILVDRLWPRGIRKDKINLWLKEIAPTEQLREYYNHEPGRWHDFKSRYTKELNKNQDLIKEILKLEKQHKTITIVYGSKTPENNAYLLYLYLNKLKDKL